jgi:hypothetical protein
LCLELNRRFERGSLLSVVLEGENTARRLLVVDVVCVKQQSPKRWKLGCQFDRQLCEFEVQELLGTARDGT